MACKNAWRVCYAMACVAFMHGRHRLVAPGGTALFGVLCLWVQYPIPRVHTAASPRQASRVRVVSSPRLGDQHLDGVMVKAVSFKQQPSPDVIFCEFAGSYVKHTWRYLFYQIESNSFQHHFNFPICFLNVPDLESQHHGFWMRTTVTGARGIHMSGAGLSIGTPGVITRLPPSGGPNSNCLTVVFSLLFLALYP